MCCPPQHCQPVAAPASNDTADGVRVYIAAPGCLLNLPCLKFHASTDTLAISSLVLSQAQMQRRSSRFIQHVVEPYAFPSKSCLLNSRVSTGTAYVGGVRSQLFSPDQRQGDHLPLQPL